MARAMFVEAWARRQEEKPSFRGWHGQEIMGIAPKTSLDAKRAARALGEVIVRVNGALTLADLYARAIEVGGRGSPTRFGHYLAMEAMGVGVSWFDDNPKFDLELPLFEYYVGRGRYAGHEAKAAKAAERAERPVKKRGRAGRS